MSHVFLRFLFSIPLPRTVCRPPPTASPPPPSSPERYCRTSTNVNKGKGAGSTAICKLIKQVCGVRRSIVVMCCMCVYCALPNPLSLSLSLGKAVHNILNGDLDRAHWMEWQANLSIFMEIRAFPTLRISVSLTRYRLQYLYN